MSPSPFGPEVIRPAAQDNSPEDLEANDFACALLMPEIPFRQAVETCLGNPLTIADRFGVPVESVFHRAQMLGLVGDLLDKELP